MTDIHTWLPNAQDLAYAEFLLYEEDYSKVAKKQYSKDDEFFSGMLFSAFTYSILSRKEQFKANKDNFKSLLNLNAWTAKEFRRNNAVLKEHIYTFGLGKTKFEVLDAAAQRWDSLGIEETIREDENMEQGRVLRDIMTKEIKGTGYKLNSLFLRMCGYHNIVPVDSTAIHFVESRGFVFRYKNSGLKQQQYVQYENIISKEAEKIGISPALFQAAIYTKFSTWKKDSGILEFQNFF